MLWLAAAVATIALPAAAGAHAGGARTAGPVGGVVRSRVAPKPTAPKGASTPNLRYGGGPVMRTNTVYTIYWHPPGTTFSPAYQSTIDGYFQDVAASSGATDDVYSNNVQYSDTTGTIAHASTFGGTYVDTTSPLPQTCRSDYGGLAVSACVTETDEQHEIQHVLDTTGWTPSATTMFFLFTPPGTGSCTDGVCAYTYFCAYHSIFQDSQSRPVIWANQPFPVLAGVATDACDSGNHPNGDLADATINLASHEHIEAITDPDTESGWLDNQGEEIADKCAWDFGQSLGRTGGAVYNQAIGGGKYYLQQEWSNGLTACVLRQPDTPSLLVSSFTPSRGSAGTKVTIFGMQMADVTGVAFGGAPASFAHVGPTELAATVPAAGASGPITVTTADGSADTDAPFLVVPSIDGLSATTGQVGDEVVISGTSLGDASVVRFGAVPDPDFVVDSPGQITAHVPETALTGPISVSTDGGTLKSAVFHVRPTLDALATASGPVGTLVALTGKTLAGTSKVTFGAPGALATLLSVTSSRVVVKVPDNAVGGPVTVTNPGGSTETAESFKVLPRVTSSSPGSGVAGTVVTVRGNGLAGTTGVSFGGAPGTVVSASGATVVAAVPATAVKGPVVVTTAGGGSATAGTFRPLPKLAAPDPAQAGGTVVLPGSNLLGATSLKLNGASLPFAVDSAQQLHVTIPLGATTGTVAVTTPSGTSGGVTLRVRPTILSFAPASGRVGSTVTITGRTLKSPSRVTFTGASSPAAVRSSSPTTLVVTVPRNAVTGPIAVTNAGGTTVSAGAFTVLP